MATRPIRIRRGRRTDFTAVMELLVNSGAPVPPPDRTTLRRFRQLVADLGCDFYLATIDERVVGVAHVIYARQLASPPSATVETLLVGESERRRGVGTALLQFAAARARQRTCTRLRCAMTEAQNQQATRFLHRAGGQPAGTLFEVRLSADE